MDGGGRGMCARRGQLRNKSQLALGLHFGLYLLSKVIVNFGWSIYWDQWWPSQSVGLKQCSNVSRTMRIFPFIVGH